MIGGKFKDILTPQEMEAMWNFSVEASDKANEILQLFSSDTRGFMLFMLAIDMLKHKHSSLETGKALERVAEWFAAGAPEDIKEVPEKVIARALKEANGNQRPN